MSPAGEAAVCQWPLCCTVPNTQEECHLAGRMPEPCCSDGVLIAPAIKSSESQRRALHLRRRMVGNSRTQRILMLQRVLLLPAAGGRLGTASPVLRCAVQWHGSCSAQSRVKPRAGPCTRRAFCSASQRCSQPWWPFFLFPFHFSPPLPVTFPRINAAVRFSALQMQAGK